ncbi:HIT domain-containing protein [Candidatus Woesearchaeota archaeon]|nr:HIT domain-containing protein [Candidatus Woesearchaeota archaeon]
MALTEDDLKNMSPEEIAELQKKNCVFCQIASGQVPAKKIYEDEHCIAVLDISPANLGHMLLFPKEHYSVMPQLPDELTGHIFGVAKKLSQAALKAFKLRGTTIFVANGMAAGQKAPHVLVHIIPRAFEDGIHLELPQNSTEEQQRKARNAIKAYLERFGSRVIKKPAAKTAPKEKAPEKEGKVAKVGVKKEKGYLYFVDKEGDIAKAKMARGGKKGKKKAIKAAKKKTVKKKAVKKKDTGELLDDIAGLFR